ncbi:MAG: hypothetical protein HWQ35_15900 [Nostoc sp. NMS1]|uniref:hypothetical protein n=1 Tax=unclassified Nostoc TaxID=2593658 RepID=UPI0025E51901|nr:MULTISPECIES: hypothetical protein [unclassified Nostoc]MBN3907979.1 hypothetical protein [Nostoc sp. NMS1]MBN3989458.1 hypothetical protein [Nostoc sp. NMS2]
MTYQIYSHQQLQLKSIARLKQIYSEIACTVEVSDKRCKDSWISTITSRAPEAIADYQASKIQKLSPAAPDNQALAQAELDHFIATQAQEIAPQPLTTVEINFYHHEVYCGKELIAYIAYDHDEFVTQPWLVMVNGVDKFRATTTNRCQRYIQWHHQDGTLRETFPAPVEVPEVPTILEISFYDQEAFVGDKLVASISYDHDNYQNLYWRVLVNNVEIFRDISAARCHSYIKQQYQQGTLPVQEQLPEEVCTIGNEIMGQIFTESEKYGFEILDDGIYNNDIKLGEVGHTDGGWWVIQAYSGLQQKVGCDSVGEAV